MPYCTSEDIYRKYGQDAIVQLAERGGAENIDIVVDEAIAAASRRIDSYVARVVALPLNQDVIDASDLPDICVSLAYAWLWAKIGDVDDYASEQEKAAVSRLRDIASGKAAIPGAAAGGQGVYSAPSRTSAFDWSKY